MRFLTFLCKNLLRRKTRSLLTAFGIAIAVGTTVSLLGIADGFRRTTLRSFEGRGVDLIVLEKGVVDQLSSDIDEKALEKVRAMPGVKDVSPGLVDYGFIPIDGDAVTTLMQGWDPTSPVQNAITIKSGGRKLSPDDGRVAILGVTLAENTGKSVGDTVEIEGEDFEIVGIYESITTIENCALSIPLREMQRVQFREGRITGFSVIVDREAADEGLVERVRSQIEALTDENGKSFRLTAQLTRDYVDESSHIQIAQSMAWLTSTIAIVVGAIGMLNTMIMSVVERVREISILRAIGWRKSRVIRMILGESLLLSSVGAAIGSIGAMVLTRFLANLPAASGVIQGPISPYVLVFGTLMALVVGLIGGLYPAVRAAGLMPSEGLRHE